MKTHAVKHSEEKIRDKIQNSVHQEKVSEFIIYISKHIEPLRAANIAKNIARIANAVQVTICLLVSTSVY